MRAFWSSVFRLAAASFGILVFAVLGVTSLVTAFTTGLSGAVVGTVLLFISLSIIRVLIEYIAAGRHL